MLRSWLWLSISCGDKSPCSSIQHKSASFSFGPVFIFIFIFVLLLDFFLETGLQ